MVRIFQNRLTKVLKIKSIPSDKSLTLLLPNAAGDSRVLAIFVDDVIGFGDDGVSKVIEKTGT